jgi:hypothetical protein
MSETFRDDRDEADAAYEAFLKRQAKRVAKQDLGWYDDYNRYWSKPSDIFFKEGYDSPFPPQRRRKRAA